MRRLTTAVAAGLALAALAVPAAAGKDEPPDFPYEAFHENETTARWLTVYDRVAWHSSDLVLQEPEEELRKLGEEWFCYESSGTWHAVYGIYDVETDAYRVSFHYEVTAEDGVVPSEGAIDEALVHRFGRALRTALDARPEGLTSLPVRFNHYIRTLEDDRIEVWILPGGQPDGTLIFGGDARYLLDPTGTQIQLEELNFTQFRGVHPKPDMKLNINREGNDVPSVGDIFFLLTFRNQFESVTIWNRCSLTQMVDPEGHDSVWIHAVRERPECSKKAKKKRSRRDR